MRVVVDTNVLVSALIRPQGAVGQVLLRLRRGDFVLLYSRSLLEEWVDVLNRPRIRAKYRLTDQDIRTVMGFILVRGEAVAPVQRVTACRDPKDDKYLEAAVAGEADAIVTGDKDLLELHPYAGRAIVAPSEFLRTLDKKQP